MENTPMADRGSLSFSVLLKDMWRRGAGDQTTNPVTEEQHTLEPQPSYSIDYLILFDNILVRENA